MVEVVVTPSTAVEPTMEKPAAASFRCQRYVGFPLEHGVPQKQNRDPTRCGPRLALKAMLSQQETQMHQDRVFDSALFFRAGEEVPPRVVITESSDSAVVCWHVEPGQHIELHVHPGGQDTWIVLAGEGRYFPDQSGHFLPLRPGVVAIATRGAVHGALNTGSTALRFVSVVSPAESGFEPVAVERVADR